MRLAKPGTIEAKAMMGTLEGVTDHAAGRKIGAEVRAACPQCTDPPVVTAKEDQRTSAHGDAPDRTGWQRRGGAQHIPGLRITRKVLRIWRSQR